MAVLGADMPLEKRTIDGVELAYRVTGDAAARPIVLIHGLTANMLDWRLTVKPLTEAGWRVLTPDCPGHGDSSALLDASAYAMTRVADLLHKLAVELGFAPAVIAGHSMGGAIAEEYVIRHGADVGALVLVDSAGGKPRRAEPDAALRDLIATERKLAFAQGMEAVWDFHQEHGMWASAKHAPPAIRQMLKARFCTVSPQGHVYGDEALGTRRDTRPELRQYAKQALVVCGENEIPELKKAAEELADALPGARRETIEGAWHSPQVENAAAFNAVLLDFLKAL
jgi:pimeloyl-ACP methyl ester carboxylesterase